MSSGRSAQHDRPRHGRFLSNTFVGEEETSPIFTFNDSRSYVILSQEPEYLLKTIPDTNPRLEAVRWKQYHAALGP